MTLIIIQITKATAEIFLLFGKFSNLYALPFSQRA